MKKELVISQVKKKINTTDKVNLNINLFSKDSKTKLYLNDRWSDSINLIKDFNYLNKIYENKLNELSKFLNNYHGKNYNKKYWRILIGKWLFHFICILFERHSSLNFISKKKIELKFGLMKYDFRDFIPYGIEDFNYQIQTNVWNEYINSEIINQINYKNVFKYSLDQKLINSDLEIIYKKLTVKEKNVKSKLYNIFKSNLLKLNKNINFFLFDTRLSNFEELNLSYKLNKKLFVFKSLKSRELFFDLNRNNINLSKYRNEKKLNKCKNFNNLLNKLLIKNIPKVYLEYFIEAKKILNKKNLPQKPKAIFTTLGINRSTLMDIYIADKVSNNTKLFLAQHGGNYGQHKAHWESVHESKISNTFFSWGKINLRNSYNVGIIKKTPPLKYNKNNKLIIVEIRNAKLFTFSLKVDTGAKNSYDYIVKIKKFLSLIKNKQILDNLRIKNHEKSWGLNEKNLFILSNSKIKFLNPKLKMLNELNKVRIMIHTFPSTGHLECMSSNIPMLLFYFNDMNLMEKQTRKYFQKLKEEQILFTDPQKLYKKLLNVNKDPEKWWYSKRIQRIVKSYTNNFAMHNSNIADDIYKHLKKV